VEAHHRHLEDIELRLNNEACPSIKKGVSERVVPTAPHPAVQTKYLLRPQHPTHSKMRYDPSDGPQTAVLSAPTWPLDGPCSRRSERAKPCQDGTVIRERSNANVNAENKCKTSSITPRDRGTDLDLPRRAMKEPNLQVGQVGMHVGAIKPKRSETNVGEMKHHVSTNSPRDRGEAVTQPRLPKREVQRSNKDTHRQDACRTGVRRHSPRRKWGGKNVDLRQHIIRDSNHVAERSSQRSHQQKTRDSTHASEISQCGLGVPHSASI
jgi:hypothetical protein